MENKNKKNKLAKVTFNMRIRPGTLLKLTKIAENKEKYPTELAREVLENYVKQFD